MVFLVRYRPVECTEKSVKLRGKSHLWTMVDVVDFSPTREAEHLDSKSIPIVKAYIGK